MFLIDQKLQKTKIDSQRILTTRYFLTSYAVKLIFGGLLSHIDDCWHKYLICWEMVGVRFTRGVRLWRLPPTVLFMALVKPHKWNVASALFNFLFPFLSLLTLASKFFLKSVLLLKIRYYLFRWRARARTLSKINVLFADSFSLTPILPNSISSR